VGLPAPELPRHAPAHPPRSAAAAAWQEDLEALQEGLDAHSNRDAAAKALYVAKLVPALTRLLDEVPPQFTRGAEQQARLTALQTLHKLLAPQQPDDITAVLFATCLKVLQADSQENAVLACTIVYQLLRLRRHQLLAQQGGMAPVEATANSLLKLMLQARPGRGAGVAGAATYLRRAAERAIGGASSACVARRWSDAVRACRG